MAATYQPYVQIITNLNNFRFFAKFFQSDQTYENNMITSFKLLEPTSPDWVETVLTDFDSFLQDHAAAERKAHAVAMSMIAHYPDRTSLVAEMLKLAIEELVHFRQVVTIMQQRDLIIAPDTKDEYINQLRKVNRNGRDEYFLDRLLIASIVEARGYERFALVGQNLPAGELKSFYQNIARSEEKHYTLFLELAHEYFAPDVIAKRVDELLRIEARIVRKLPLRAALH